MKKHNLKKLYQKPVRTAYYAILLIVICFNLFTHVWNRGDRVIKSDVQGYYAYLPATFIYHDLQFNFLFDPDNPYREEQKKDIWFNFTEDGDKIIQYTTGLAICYAPFFFIAHLGAKLFDYPAHGYSIPYDFMLQFGAVLFFIMGIYFLKRILELYYSEKTAALTLIAVVLGTNLFYYGTYEAAMSHCFSFAFIAMFVWLLLKWLERPAWQTTIQLGLTTGMIILIRPSNILIVSLFMLINVSRFSDLGERIRYFIKNYRQILIMILAAFVVWIPQMLYWYSVTGQVFYNSYGGDQGFLWGDPQILSLLFSYRKGWLLYTPVMGLAVIGLIPLYRKHRGLFWPSLFVMMLAIYVFASWCFWWFGGSFGSRGFIDFYAVFAIPMAAMIDFILKQKSAIIRWAFIAIIAFFIFLNQYQIKQYKKGHIHYVSMTKDAYWSIFLKKNIPPNYNDMLEYPDYDGAIEKVRARKAKKEKD